MPCIDWEGGSSVNERQKRETVEVPGKENGSGRCKTSKCGGKPRQPHHVP